MHFEYVPGATPTDPDEALDLIPVHITTQADLNAWEEMNIVEDATWIKCQKIVQVLDEGLVQELHKKIKSEKPPSLTRYHPLRSLDFLPPLPILESPPRPRLQSESLDLELIRNTEP